MSREFKDSEGRTWRIAISTLSIKRVNEDCGRLLTAIGDSNFALLQELHENHGLTVDILWCLVQRQARGLGVVDDEDSQATEKFAEGMAGDALYDATEALVGAISDFFPNQALRDTLAKAIQTAHELAKLRTEIVAMELAKIDPAQAAKSYMDAVLHSQPSPELTLGATPSAN